MRILNKKILSSAAAVAMIAAMPSAAFAFDGVEWNWGNEVIQTTTLTVDVRTDVDTTGLTQVEKLQVQIGDVNASSIVNGVTNNQPTGTGGGTGTFSETFTFNTDLEETSPGELNNILSAGPQVGTDPAIVATFDGGTVDENNPGPLGDDATELTFTVEGTVTVDPTDSLDAEMNLPSVESAATAVGNNQSIASDVATYLHDGQFLFDVQGDDDQLGFEDVVGGLAAVALGSEFIDNSHTAFAVGATVLGITGTIEKANVDSISAVSNIINASVDSSATAVGNNMSVDVNPDGTPNGDSVLIADMTQFALADISASSTVHGVTVSNYTNLAKVNPLVSSAATAVGNNVSINVGNVGDL